MDQTAPRLTNEEAKERLAQLLDDPQLDQFKESFKTLPIWGMLSGAFTFLLTDYAIKTNRFAPKAPRMARIGTAVFRVPLGANHSLLR